jgi:predicted dehydrogenase
MTALRLRIASIGVGGRGWMNTIAASQAAEVVALCDVDERQLARFAGVLPDARTYTDYRELLQAESALDAVVISTPDHSHAAIAIAAMRGGLHCYCEKPLARTLEEVEQITGVAAQTGRITQLGTQGLADGRSREAIEVIRAGTLGRITEIHAWTDRPGHWWPSQFSATEAERPSPGFHWQQWLNGRPGTPYSSELARFKWRGHREFGTGALGDMGAHILAVPFLALGLGAAVSVDGEWETNTAPAFPSWSRLRFRFADVPLTSNLTLHWYDGGLRPPQRYIDDFRMDDNGCIVVGEEGRYYFGGWSAHFKYLLPASTFIGYAPPVPTLGRVSGHMEEWLDACAANGGSPLASFDRMAPLMLTLLLGNTAITTRAPCSIARG